VKNDCLTCPVLDYGHCPLFEYAYHKKGLDGLHGCEMRARIEYMLEKTKKNMRQRYGGKVS
jgi:hypothetical protein